MSDDYEDIAFSARQAVTAVYDALGPGFRAETYRAALMIELKEHGIPFESDVTIEVKYKNNVVDRYKLDFVLYGKVLLMINADGEHHPKYKARVVSQIKAAKFNLGLYVDFGMQQLQLHKILNPDFYFGASQAEDTPGPFPRPSGKKDRKQDFEKLFGE